MTGRGAVPMTFARRDILKGALLGTAALLPFEQPIRAATAQETPARRHGMSVFGELKYPPDFAHFDYVRPDAPKGGLLSQVPHSWAFNQNPNTFDSLNTFIFRGSGPVGIEIIFDTLMTRAWDEPDALYGLLAEGVEPSADGNTYRFFLRPEARWHDGTPVTADDVAFTLNIFKAEGHPLISQTITDMESASAVSDATVDVLFNGDQSRDLPQVVAALPILSRAYYETRVFNESTLEPPLASGPYRIGKVDVGRAIEYHREDDYWARDLNVNVGRYNFDIVRYDFFRDRDVSFEAFKAGVYWLREEFTSRVWATGYDFPAARDGRVVRAELSDGRPSGAQGWFINTRRSKFADPRVREALIHAFDFEWSNTTLFFDLYSRTASFFENSPMKAEGPPSAAELALLEPFRAQVPEEVFDEPFTPPVSDGSGQDRRLLRQASRLLNEAGYEVVDGVRLTVDGVPFEIEFIDNDGSLDRIVQPYIRNLRRLGIQARSRVVDAAQFQRRVNEFDFDMIVRRYAMATIPGEGIKRFWGSEDANRAGSNNLSGIADPVVDALVQLVIDAPTREDQIVAARALDRVLRAGRYWVPQWYKAAHHLAYWDAYDRPATKPDYIRGVTDTWWFDPDRAAAAGLDT